LDQLQAESEWQQGDRNAITVIKEGDLRMTLTALRSGARLDPHRVDGYMSIQVMAGRLRVASTDTHAFLLTIALPQAA
jgi:hypothetical protein